MTAAYVSPIDTVALLVQVGDGGGPEVFTAPILINTARGVSMSAAATAQEVARTDDVTAPAKTVRKVTSTDTSISGDGTLHQSDAKSYADWLLSGLPKNIKVNVGSATGDLVLTGSFVLTKFTLTGSKMGDLVTASVQFDQADLPAATAHA